ncbi:MAG: glutamine--tRNA ligase/YqeY domain fusion protein, partial [Clostridia bacterium]|nr:glutamine--tRNA ligase/YqeY domain fusion protein [Clostridia bacterium]
MEKSTNFIEDIINNDLESGKHKEIITRFPPEPNGYLHIGHAKSLCINFGMKEKYNGKCNLRYDDTNPAKEDVEYVDSIKKDIEWLGFKWDKELYASDYFDRMYECAVLLIKKGLAFVCDCSSDEIRESRGTLVTAGKNSPYRNRSVEENLDLFSRKKAGEFADGSKVLRVKIDMASPNINMRDPIIYRILRETHHRTGDKWCIYPMYDFAHPLEDAFEGITHSICTLEFEDHRPLYDWVKINCGFEVGGPRQIEFARLNMNRTIMSKRYLKKLVDEHFVDGWSDPRMPTLSGMRERGYPAEAIRDFCERVGVAKANSEVNTAMLEFCVRENLNAKADRAMVVKDPIKMIIAGVTDEVYEVENNPNAEEKEYHKVTFSNEIFIERDDFMIAPPPKYKRLVVGGTVRLRNSYIVQYKSHECDENGNVLSVNVEIIPDSKSGGANAGMKVKGVIHWVNAKDYIPCILHEYDYLLMDGEGDFNERLNPNSHIIFDKAVGEASLKNAKPYDRFQFMRIGYYSAVGTFGKDNKYEFNRIVSLKDSFN